MQRPKAIQLWSEDPLDNKFLCGVQFEYDIKDAGTGYYKKMVKLMRNWALIAAKHLNIEGLGIRKPQIRMKFIYHGAKTKGFQMFFPLE